MSKVFNFKKYRKYYLLLVDIVLVTAISALFAVLSNNHDALPYFIKTAVALNLIFVAVFKALHLYSSLWSYAEADEFIRCIGGIAIATVFSFPALKFWVGYGCSTSLMLPVFVGMMLMFFRIIYRYYRMIIIRRGDDTCKRMLIVGAGAAGSTLLSELTSNSSKYTPVCIVDDDMSKQGMYIRNVRIAGTTADIPAICEEYKIDTIMVAIINISEKSRSKLYEVCSQTSCDIKILPPFLGVKARGSLSEFKSLRIEDLLNREPIKLEDSGLDSLISGETVLVTGAGGSIGSELCRQISKLHPKKLVMLDISENTTYELEQEFKMANPPYNDMSVQIASVRDLKKLDLVFKAFKPSLVFHAAAHKHVPLMETNPEEAVKNNVFGTFNVAAMADKYHVKKFVLISTDKAVNPTNIMGSTKQLAEMVVNWHGSHSKTIFTAVRFGNVLGSNGSVVPLFKRQIEKGGPVTVTHPDIIRYFMTISEAVSLVLRAASMANDSEVFVLDMGKPVKIKLLAEQMIRLSGHTPGGDIKIEYTGLRPGEKLFEELLVAEDGLVKTADQRIFIGHQAPFEEKEFLEQLEELQKRADVNDQHGVISQIHCMVPTYHRDLAPLAKLAVDE